MKGAKNIKYKPKINLIAMASDLLEALEEAIATAKAAALSPVAYKKWEKIAAKAKEIIKNAP